VRIRLVIAVSAAIAFSAPATCAENLDAVEQCKDFFRKFEKCVDGLKGDQQDEARIFMKTLRGTLGMSDDLNNGDPMMIGIMCGITMQETKKEPSVQKYNCQW
jgi:hypothetical protein